MTDKRFYELEELCIAEDLTRLGYWYDSEEALRTWDLGHPFYPTELSVPLSLRLRIDTINEQKH